MNAGRAIAVAAAVVAIDQASKAAVDSLLSLGERIELLPFLAIANTRNEGVAFGLLGDVSPFWIAVSLAGLIAALVLVAGYAGRPLWLPAGLLVGGAVGNLVDRLRIDSVVDFIDVPAWPTFNLADVAITAGVVSLVLAGHHRAQREVG